MSTPSPTDTNLDRLREMTGAPDLTEPLVSDTAFDTVPTPSARPLWKLPVPKLLLIGAALLPVFALAGLFIAGGRDTRLATPPTVPVDPDNEDAEADSVEAELEQARAEIATLKAQMALEDQGHLEPTFAAATPSPASTPTAPPSQPAATPPPRSASVPRSTPAYRAPAPTSIPAPPRAPVVTAVPQPEVVVDPAEQWRELVQVGSYGRVAASDVSNEPLTSSQPIAQARFTDTPPTASLALSQTVPLSTAADHHVGQPAPSLLPYTPAFSTSERPDPQPVPPDALLPSMATSIGGPSGPPTILASAEARILQAAPSGPQTLVAGTQSAGELATPVVLDTPAEDTHFLVVLSEPLVDNQGQVAIPAGGELVVRVDDVSEAGLVELSAIQAVWQDRGAQRELWLPDRYIQIRGQAGTPLTADHYGDLGPAIAAMDAGQFALGAIRRASELYNRSDTRVERGDGSTVITEETPDPNLLAGILEGGTDTLLDTLTARNQQAMTELSQRPRIAYIEAGRPVQIFVNQTMQIPI